MCVFSDALCQDDYGESRERKFRQWSRNNNRAETFSEAFSDLSRKCRDIRNRNKSWTISALFKSPEWEDYIQSMSNTEGVSDFDELSSEKKIKCFLELIVASINQSNSAEDKKTLKELINYFEASFYGGAQPIRKEVTNKLFQKKKKKKPEISIFKSDISFFFCPCLCPLLCSCCLNFFSSSKS
jgi:hypothetical protein